MNNLSALFQAVRDDFTSLWECKERGDTLEIITPYSLLSGESVSVFVTMRNDRYIVSDGARLSEIEDMQGFCLHDRKSVYYSQMLEKFGIKEAVRSTDDAVFRYKSTSEMTSFTSAVYDMINFHETLGNQAFLATLFNEEEDSVHRFSTKVKEVIHAKIRVMSHRSVRYEWFLNPEARLWQFNAGIRKIGTQDIWLGMSIARSNLATFRASVQRAEFGFNHIQKTSLAGSAHLHLGAVVEELPHALKSSPSVITLEAAMVDWADNFSARCHPIARFEDAVGLDSLVAA